MNLEQTLNEGHDAYLEHGSRSTKKLNILHDDIARHVAANLVNDKSIISCSESAFPFAQLADLGYEFKTKSRDGEGKEKKVTYGIDTQDIDIYVKVKATGVEGCIEVKFPLRNMRQNRKNNLLNIIGITALMETCRSSDSLYHAVALFYPVNAPYFTKEGAFKHQENFDVRQAIEEWNRLFFEHPHLAPYSLSIVFFEFVAGDPDDIAGSFESKNVSLRLHDASDALNGIDLHPALFVNDFDGFTKHFANSLSSITKKDLIAERARRSFYAGARKMIGEDAFDAMSEAERKEELIKLMSGNEFTLSSMPTI